MFTDNALIFRLLENSNKGPKSVQLTLVKEKDEKEITHMMHSNFIYQSYYRYLRERIDKRSQKINDDGVCYEAKPTLVYNFYALPFPSSSPWNSNGYRDRVFTFDPKTHTTV